ncbi:MAG TPA: phosphatidylglycerophosphatase A [Candidatus Krumholzibacteria bacterium]
MNPVATCFATFFYTGFFPFAPATFATFVFLLVYVLVPGGDWLATWTIFLPTLVLSVPASSAVEKTRGKDPHCVVIDEVVGIQVALVGATPTLAGVAAAFVLFRIFDVWKPFPIDRLQSLPRGWGIVADDMVAGIYTRAVLMLAALVTHALGRFPL